MGARKPDGSAAFVPALAYRALTPLYDPVVRFTVRERTFKQALLSQAGIRAGMDVLDLGCGTGTLAIQAKAQNPDATVIGLDGDPTMLARAQRKAVRAATDIRFDEGLSFELPYADASFDRVLSSLFFHHLVRADKVRTLVEVRRVLRSGGELHIADWGEPQDPVMRMLSRSISMLDGRAQTEDNLAGRLPDLVRDAGFSSVTTDGSLRTVYGTLILHRAVVPDGS